MEFKPAFHNDPTIKDKMLRSAIAHRRGDTFVQGLGEYFEEGKGCHLGCAVMSVTGKRGNWHRQFSDLVNCHPEISNLQEYFFESLPMQKDRLWSESVIDAMPVGADLDRGYWSFMAWMLIDPDYGVIACESQEQARLAIQEVGLLCRRSSAGDMPTESEWTDAARAADAALAADAARPLWAARSAGAAVEAGVLWSAGGSEPFWAVMSSHAVREAVEAREAQSAEEVWAARAAHIQRMAEQLIIEMANSPFPDKEQNQRPAKEIPSPAIREVLLV